MLTKMAALRFLLLAAMMVSAIQPSKTQALSLISALAEERLSNTNFSCIGKVIGGYYADVYAGCQMFHVCTLDEKGEIHDYTFDCLLGTVFDQETRVCERADEVDCSISESFFHLNDELYGPGIIPPTADTAATSSAATVHVLDPSVALLAATISPPASTDTSTGPSSVPPNPPPTIPSTAAAPPTPPSQPVPTSSPPPPIIPPGVTASSASSSSRMSTSTSSSVTAAYSFPPLPFTVSRTSTSVSASARVRIQTPLAQISINQGIGPSILPAPHLRPSLLRLAAQAQNAGLVFHGLNPTSPSPITSRTPADFEDVPRLPVTQKALFNTNINDGSAFRSRQKRQTTHGSSSNQPTTSTGNAFRSTTSSRGRKRFRPVARQGSSSVSANPLRTGTLIQNTQVGNTSTRQRGQVTRIRQNNSNSRRLQNREQEQSITVQPRGRRPGSGSRRRQEITSVDNQSNLSVKSQQDSPIEKTPRPQVSSSQPFTRVAFVRPRISSQLPVTNNPLDQNHPFILRGHSDVRNQGIIMSKQPTPLPDTISETLPHHDDPILRNDPLPFNDPTPLPPTVLTAELPPDSVYRVSDEATGGTDFPTTTQTAFVFPETSFLCNDKVPGGLYADIETGCVVFHICSVGPDSSITDNKFICGVGTLFDQKSRTCQVASAVDCSRSESLFYLNDRLRGPVFLELDPQLPEQQFDFPRLQSSPSSLPDAPSPPSRFRRYAENVVDLCLSHPLGTPLADLTSGCQNYVVCESLSDKRIVERHRACKKDSLFSQMRKRCLPSKKVDCNKETISGILGMDSSKREKGKKRVTRSLLLHRLRRAALPPLVNVVTNAGMEDARVRRALYSLAVLQRWALENARDTTFIEVYTLNTKEVDYPKKAYAESPQLTRYGYIHRKKRDVAEQALLSNQTKTEETFLESSSVISSDQEMEEPQEELQGTIISPTSTIPVTLPTPVTHPTTATLITTTVTPKTRKTTSAVPRQTVLPKIISVSPSTSFSPSPTKISATLSTVTISNTGPRIIKTVTLPAATVTVTNTVTVGLPTTENPIVNTAVPTLPMTSEEVSAPLPITSSTITGVDLVRNISKTTAEPIHSAFNVSEKTSENSTPSTQSLSTSAKTIQNSTPALALTTESSSALNASSSPQDEITEKSVLVTPTPSSAEEKKVTSPDSTLVSSSPSLPGNLTSSPSLPGNLTSSPSLSGNLTSSPSLSGNLTSSPSLPGNLTSTPATTTLQVETAVTEASAGNASVTVSTNITTTTTASITKVIPPLGSVDTSTTVLPSDLNITNNASTEAVTQAPTPTIGPFTRENLPETNFTCKDKKLEQFYPDTEANCQVFHYCSPGFEDTQILDLKFLCTGATMFDVNTQKCENLSSVTCGHNITIVTPDIPPIEATPPIETIPPIEATPPIETIPPIETTEVTPTIPPNETTEVTPIPINVTVTTIPVTTSTHGVSSTTNSTTTVNLTTTGPPLLEQHDRNGTSEPDVITTTMKIEDDSIAVTSTVEPEVNTVEIDVTDRVPREENTTSTSNISETYTATEFVLEDESLITTELGPFIQQPSKLFEMLNEDKKSDEPLEDKSEPTTDLPVQASTTISVPLFSLTTVPVPLQISNSSSPPLPALNNTNISSSVMNISSTEVSENTNIETPL